MSIFLNQLLEIQKPEYANMDFHPRTVKLIEMLKQQKQENTLREHELAEMENYISATEDEYENSLTWFPIEKIKQGLNKIETDPDFVVVYPEWKEYILIQMNAFAAAKFSANVIKRVQPSPDKEKYGSQLEAKFDFLNKIFRNKKSNLKGRNFSENDLHQIINSNKLPYKLTEIANKSVRSLQKNGEAIPVQLADEIINLFGEKFLSPDIEFIQKLFFDGFLDVIGTSKINKKTGEESVTAKCRLLWCVFIHTHPKQYHEKDYQARTRDELNRESLLKIVQQ